MEESIVERVLILMKEYELTASEFADKIDVQRSSMSHLVSGRNKPSLDFIQKILNNFSDINPTWLIMGTGPMKQLNLFNLKGGIAPIEPIPSENFRIKHPVDEQIKSTIKEQEFPDSVLETKKISYTQSAHAASLLSDSSSRQAEESIEEAPIAINSPVSLPVQEPILSAAPVITPEPKIHSPKTNSGVVDPDKSVQNDKKVVKIVFFYSDNTFETFNPH